MTDHSGRGACGQGVTRTILRSLPIVALPEHRAAQRTRLAVVMLNILIAPCLQKNALYNTHKSEIWATIELLVTLKISGINVTTVRSVTEI